MVYEESKRIWSKQGFDIYFYKRLETAYYAVYYGKWYSIAKERISDVKHLSLTNAIKEVELAIKQFKGGL